MLRNPPSSPRRGLRAAASLLVLASVAGAQYSSDPAVNLSAADGPSDQSQPKLRATSDGGVWLSWFDGIGTGFDVRVQKLAADGGEVLAHDGVLVADRAFSSTQDYGLDVHTSGDAVLAYRYDFGPGTQIFANRVSDTGAFAWGATGVQLTNTTAFVASPKIAATADGGAIIAWTQDSSVRLQKLDSAGTRLWGTTGIAINPAAGTYSVSDLHGAGDGAVLSFVHQTGGFGSPRHILAQKFDGTGALLWGATHVSVLDNNSLQFGNFPSFEPDGAGGGVFSWYETAGVSLQCRAQHVLPDGSEAFVHNGVALSTNAVRQRVSPSAVYDATSGETTVFWTETNSLQSQDGVWGQRLDASGNRLWTDEGAELVPLGAATQTWVTTLLSGADALVVWETSPAFGQDVLNGAFVDATGALDGSIFDVASTPSGKLRLDGETSSTGVALYAWMDDRVDASDVFVQNVNVDGSLGNGSPWSDLGFALAGTSGVPTLVGTGTLVGGDPTSLDIANGLGSANTYFVIGASALSGAFKGGTLVPFPNLVVSFPLTPSGEATIAFAWPLGLPSALPLWWQAWIQDAGGPVGWAATNALLSVTP
ncbi:MAG: hypothetical protein H6825_07320 [Planctomycetes bacterium]|nr:hypothetical protein [Planctomycetota bacterium]